MVDEPPSAPSGSAPRDLATLRAALAAFNRERDWEQFHRPRDLAMALSVEAGELLELFLWKADDAAPERARLREELGDVLICLVNLAARLDVDLLDAAYDKLANNARKYPVAAARGNAKKWDELAPGAPDATAPEDDR